MDNDCNCIQCNDRQLTAVDAAILITIVISLIAVMTFVYVIL